MSDVGLGATLQLDIADALARIDQLQTQIDAATSNVQVSLDDPDATPVTQSIDQAVEAADTSVEPEADSAGVTESIDQAVDAADTTVPVDADTDEATAAIAAVTTDAEATPAIVPVAADTAEADAAIEGVVAEAESAEAVIPVSADTTEAEDAIGGLGDEAEGAGEQLEHTSGILEGFAGNTETATGLAAGLGSTLGKLGPEAAAGAAGIGAVLEVTKSLVDNALRADTSMRRFDTTTGKFADDVKNINVGNLNGDLDELALKLGTSHVELENAASRVFQLGTAAGVAGPKVANTTDQVLALSLRARALNPELESSGQVAEALTSAFARGGRALVPYGISLSAAEINARALADTGKSTAAQLTVYEKAAAGAQLATEKFGGSLKQTIDEAASNPKIALDSLKTSFEDLLEKLGTPLLLPVVKDLQNLEPVAESVITVVAELVGSFVPLFDFLGSLGPLVTLALKPIEFLAKGIELANKPFELLADGIDHLTGILHRESGAEKQAKEIESLSDAMRDNTGVITLNTDALSEWIKTQSRFKTQNQLDDLRRLNISLDTVATLAEKGAAGYKEFSAAVEAGNESKNNVGDLEHSFRDLQATLDGTAAAAIAEAKASGSITEAQEKAALAAKDHVAALKELQAQIDDHNAAVAEATAKYGPLIASVTGTAKSLQTLSTNSPAAEAALKSLTSTGVQPSDTAFLNFATTIDRASLSSKSMDEIAGTLGITTDQLKGFVDGATGALSTFVSTAEKGLPQVADAFPTDSPSLSQFVKNLNDSTDQVARFMVDLQRIFAAGGQDLAGALAEQGVKSGLAYADALSASIGKDGTSKLVSNTEAAVDAHNAALQKADDFLVNTFGPEYIAQTGQISALAAQAFNSDLDFASRIRLAAELAGSTLSEQGKAIAVIAANQGNDAAESYSQLFNIDAKTVAAGERAAAAITGNTTLPADSGALGFVMSNAFNVNFTPDPTPGLSTARSGISGFGGLLAGTAGGVGADAGAALGSGTKDAIDHSKDKVAASAHGLITSVPISVISLVAQGLGGEVGLAFSQGIKLGIQAGQGGVDSAARGIVKSAEAAARAAANSHSPSLLFAELGRDLAAGTAQGIHAGVPDVVTAAEAIVAAAAQAHQAAVGDFTVGGDFATGGGPSTSTTVTLPAINVDVTISGSVTPDEAKAVGASVGDGIMEQLDRRFGVDIMLGNTKATVP